ncbi:MAG: hypothetical protein HW383_633, partial [Candidatus Magasanikbacteria bacterium]|nr:hypothetical protein [Candidatus Magasanikbacteria bacterium]
MSYEGKSALEGRVTFKSAAFGIFLHHISIATEDGALKCGKITAFGPTEAFTRQVVKDLIVISREKNAQLVDLDSDHNVVQAITFREGEDVVEIEVIRDDDERLKYTATLHLVRRNKETDELYFGRLQAIWEELKERIGPLEIERPPKRREILWPTP